jgi:hypothetical protein
MGIATQSFRDAVMLLPRASLHSLKPDTRQAILAQFCDLSFHATAAAMQANYAPSEALAMLETGRAAVASLANESSPDISALAEDYPDLSEKYSLLLAALDRDTSTGNTKRITANEIFTFRQEREYGQPTYLSVLNVPGQTDPLAEESLHRIEDEIRSLPGFQTFQKPLSHGDLIRPPRGWAIVSLMSRVTGAMPFSSEIVYQRSFTAATQI